MLGVRLRLSREARKMQQKDVCEALKISSSRYSQYETGKRTPDNLTLTSLADLYGVSIDYLLGRVNNPDEMFLVVIEGEPIATIETYPTADRQSSASKSNSKPLLVIPEELQGAQVAFHLGDIEDLTQDEIEKVAAFIRFVKSERKGNPHDLS
jgi:transcriptional regulator with XRE-family HTH domain